MTPGGPGLHRVQTVRILFVAPHFGRQGGLELYNLSACQALQRAGAQVLALSLFTSGTSMHEGVTARGLLPAPLPLRWLYYRAWRTLLPLYLMLLGRRFDVLVAGHVMVAPAVSFAARRTRRRHWLLVFGIEAWQDWAPSLRTAATGFSTIISISQFTAAAVQRQISTRVEVIPPMVDVDLFTPGPLRQETVPDAPFVLLTVGRLSSAEQYKGHELVMESLRLLGDRFPRPIVYRIVGDGEDRQRLERLAHELSVASRVEFLGKVGADHLLDLYRSCDVFVMPSKVERRPDGTWSGEGFGIVYLEAAACGAPVVAAAGGGSSEAVVHGQTGILVEPTPESVATGLERLLGDSALRHSMGAAGRALAVERFSRPGFERGWAALLREAGF